MAIMKFANIVVETNPRSINYPMLYCRSSQVVVPQDGKSNYLLSGAGTYDFTTYFNALSLQKLQKFTTAASFRLHLEIKGASCTIAQTYADRFAVETMSVEGTECSYEASESWQCIDLDLVVDPKFVLTSFIIVTDGPVEVRNSYYELELSAEPRDIELALCTTTFKKESYIISNINLINKEIINSTDAIANHFHMYVMDNGRTLDTEALSSERVTIIPEGNVGGAGGFTRGMIEAMNQNPKATHVLLMDDDVAVSAESIRRTYNLLRILKPEYQKRMISGAMLNYRVGEEQWEDIGYMSAQGTFNPCKDQLNLTLLDDLVYNELFEPSESMRKAMYAAWWYCCIPVDIIERNDLPLPVFVRCDDAEYGVRCHTGYITMNSLCIWHMSFHERYNAAVERYQTTRNTLIANAVTGFAPESDFMRELRKNIRLELKKFGYDNAQLCLDAFEDFMKGPQFIAKKGQAEQSFMDANKHKEQLLDFDALQKAADNDPEIDGFHIEDIDYQLMKIDQPRSIPEHIQDYLTDNGQRVWRTQGTGYAVIPLQGWLYPAGVIRGKKKLIVIDWYNRKGAIRTKDTQRYHDIVKRYKRDLRYYKAHKSQIESEYAAARGKLTSVSFWKDYLGMK